MLTADQARTITGKALVPESELIKPHLEQIGGRINAAAELGKDQILNPWSCGLNAHEPSPTQQIRDAVRRAIEHLGYKWEEHPDPDPGDPRGGAYTTISW